MATKKKIVDTPLKNQFAGILLKIGYRFSLSKVFEDFLTMSIAACTQNLQTRKSYYEEEYIQTIAAYKDSELKFEFSNAFAQLIIEMEEKVHSDQGNDVLGEFFEQELSHGRNGQFFTPYSICQFMASITTGRSDQWQEDNEAKPLSILDPACGSGRMLAAAYKHHGTIHRYYGIDIDLTCVKMTALNMFLNGMWNSEVMCANTLAPDDFVIAYSISLVPLGIFKVEEKQKSLLWKLHRHSFGKQENQNAKANQTDFVNINSLNQMDSTQLDLFK